MWIATSERKSKLTNVKVKHYISLADRTFPIPLILLHGAWHGGWAMSLLAQLLVILGFECYVLSFRGHEDDKPKKKKRIWYLLRQYVKDIKKLAETIESDKPPILIGQSMGGLIAQMYAQKYPISAMILLASVPSSGALGVLWRFAKKHPWITAKFFLTRGLYPAVENLDVVKELFFSDVVSEKEVREWQKKLVNESFLAYLSALWPRKFSREKMYKENRGVPVLVLHATKDAMMSHEQSKATATAYETSTIQLVMAHCDMLANEACAKQVVDCITRWFRSKEFKKVHPSS